MTGMTVSEAVRNRRSVRAFLPKQVELETLRRVMDKARWAPSGCNFQPWEATIVTGEPLRDLQAKMVATPFQDPPEYTVTPPDMPAKYTDRLFELGAHMYEAMGIARDDGERRQDMMRQNFISFGAPAVLLCYFPRLMGPPQWSDVGMWLQTVMLLLKEEGLDSCPQEFLSYHARIIKDFLGVDDESHLFFCGIAIGYADEEQAVNRFERFRIPLDEQVRFLGF